MNLRTTRYAGLICLLIALTGVVYGAQAASTQPREYSIEPGALGDTLAQFAASSNVQLLFEPAIVAGLRSGGLYGVYTVESGFARILEASAYEIVKREEGVYALVARAGNAGAKVMRKVRVAAETGSSETATSRVEGYVARRTATATKTDTPIVEIPQAINVVTSGEIVARGGARSIHDALAYTPGFFHPDSVNTRRDHGGSLRGFDMSNSLYLDGMRLPHDEDVLFKGAAFQVEPSGMERIEVLKGPTSVYGQSPPGGLVNYVSKRPTPDPLAEIYLAAGTFSRLEGAVDVSSAINDSLLYRLNGMVRRSDTQIDYVEDNRTYVAPSLTWIIGANTELTFLGHAQVDSGGEFSNELPWRGVRSNSQHGRIPRDRFLGEPDANKYDRRQYAAGYSFDHRFNGTVKVAQDFRYLEVDVDADNVVNANMNRYYDPRTVWRERIVLDASIASYSWDTRLQLDAATGDVFHNMVAGVDYRRDDASKIVDHHEYLELDVHTPVYGQFRDPISSSHGSYTNEWVQKGVYLQDQLGLGRWAVTLGGRYDWADNRGTNFMRDDDEAFTAHAGVVYSMDSIAPYIGWSESFEPQYLSGVDSSGKAIKPLPGEQVEIGLKLQPGQRTFVTLALFELKQQDIFESNLIDGATQTGEKRVRGAEVEAKANFDGWNLSASYSYIDSEVTRSTESTNDGELLGKQFINTPRHQAMLWTVYKLPNLVGLDIGGGVRYTGRYYGSDFETAENPSVTLFDLALGYDLGRRLGAESLRLSLNARNITDRQYNYCVSGVVGCTWGAKRTVQLAARYAW